MSSSPSLSTNQMLLFQWLSLWLPGTCAYFCANSHGRSRPATPLFGLRLILQAHGSSDHRPLGLRRAFGPDCVGAEHRFRTVAVLLTHPERALSDNQAPAHVQAA